MTFPSPLGLVLYPVMNVTVLLLPNNGSRPCSHPLTDHTFLWKMLKHYGIPQKLINIINYSGTSCRVIHDEQLLESFEVKSGVTQGCLLSPFLSLLGVDWIMRKTIHISGQRNGIQWTLAQQLDDLEHAGDIASLSH